MMFNKMIQTITAKHRTVFLFIISTQNFPTVNLEKIFCFWSNFPILPLRSSVDIQGFDHMDRF